MQLIEVSFVVSFWTSTCPLVWLKFSIFGFEWSILLCDSSICNSCSGCISTFYLQEHLSGCAPSVIPPTPYYLRGHEGQGLKRRKMQRFFWCPTEAYRASHRNLRRLVREKPENRKNWSTTCYWFTHNRNPVIWWSYKAWKWRYLRIKQA